jgi:Tfp pilus assembly protein PilZ
LNELLEDLADYIRIASANQKRRLLTSLGELWKTHRRRHPRKPYSIAVYYATQDHVFKDFVTNISAGGVLIETSQPFSVGEHITLTFADPDLGEPFKMTGQIVWSGPAGIGVEFTTPPNQELVRAIESL